MLYIKNKSPARWGDTGRGLDVRIAAAHPDLSFRLAYSTT
jgi:hypothetical protein